MKKLTMISLSVIFTIMILLIPGNKILAWNDTDYININYDHNKVSYYIETYSDFLEFMDSKLKEYVSQTGYKYIVYFGHLGTVSSSLPSYINYSVVFYDNPDVIYMYSHFRYDYASYYAPFGSTTNSSYLFHTIFNYSDFLNGDYNDIENIFEQNKKTTWSSYPYFQFGFSVPNVTSFNGEDFFDLTFSDFKFLYDTNANLVLKNNNDYFLPVSFDGGTTIHRDGDIFITYKTQFSDVAYDNTITFNPSEYNYFYIKFKGVGDLSFFYNQKVTTNEDLYFDMYKNDKHFKTMLFVSGGDYSISDYFSNVTEEDVFTLVLPIYKQDFSAEDTYTLDFTIPGLIEYGTNEFKYTFDNEEWVSSETDRSDVTDLLDPSENEPDEIISSGTSHNTLTNNSLNEFMWPYSLFARNGNNINNVTLTGSYSSTNSFNLNDFKTDLIINYGEEKYKINVNNCISLGNCNLTKFEQDMIKNILFDRNVENSNYYLDFSVIPQKNLQLSASDQFNFGISINFNSSVELTINSMLLAINQLSNSYYNVYFKLYDSSGQVHTIYKTALDNDYIGVNQFQLDSRTADIYRVDLMFVYNHTLSSISTTDRYSLKFSEFNIFANTEMIHIYTDNTNVTYQTCSWYDLFCHGQNLFTWLTYEAPGSSDFWSIFLYITNIFDMLWIIITYVFMPFDIIPPIFGIPMSTILPFLLIALALVKKIWFGGAD